MSIIRKLLPKKLKDKIKRSMGLNQLYNIEKMVDIISDRKIGLLNYINNKRFDDKIVVVTGATGYIGQELCKQFAREGAIVVACGRSEQKLQELNTEAANLSLKLYMEKFDILNADEIDNAFRRIIHRFERVDVLVNCAGGSARNDNLSVADQEVEVIDEIINLNLRAPILCIRAVAKQMMKQKSGSIINFASLMGVRGKEGYVDYGSAKAGVEGLTRSAAIELGKYSVNVNCVTPSYVPRLEITEQRAEQLQKANFMDSISSACDISTVVLFLASPEAKFITGQNIIVDGGRSLGLKGD